QAEDGIRDFHVTGVQTCALPIYILDKIDNLIIGGGMTFTFVKALGGNIGSSICEDDKLDLALEILAKAKQKNVAVHLPVDVVIRSEERRVGKEWRSWWWKEQYDG